MLAQKAKIIFWLSADCSLGDLVTNYLAYPRQKTKTKTSDLVTFLIIENNKGIADQEAKKIPLRKSDPLDISFRAPESGDTQILY